MYFEEVFEYIGGGGAYQWCTLMYQVAVALMNVDGAGINFIGGTMDHWCNIPVLENFTHSDQKNIAIPGEEDDEGDISYERCYRFPFPFENYTQEELQNWNRSTMTEDIREEDWVRCDQGWVYDQSVWVSTIGSQWDLVCGDSWKVGLTNSLLMAGWLVGALIVGPVSDSIGRKPTLIICYLGRIIGCYMYMYAPNYETFCVGRFICGLFYANTSLIIYVMLQEITTKKYRATYGVLVYTISSLFQMLLGLVAYLVRDHKLLMGVYMWPMWYIIPFLFLGLDESPRWLVSVGKDKEAITILKKIAQVNKGKDAKLPEDMHFKEELQKQAKIVKGTYMDLFRTPILRKRMIICGFVWFTVSLVNYGLNLNVGRLPGDVFVNFILMQFVDVPCRLLSIPLLDRLGRRWGNALFILLAGTMMLACIPLLLDTDLELGATVLAVIGKGLNSMGFTGIYSFTAELAPTTIRNIAMSFGSVCARVSGIASPYVGGPLGDLWMPLPSVVFGVMGIMAGATCWILPETLNCSLPETVADAEAFKGQKVILCGKKKEVSSSGDAETKETKGDFSASLSDSDMNERDNGNINVAFEEDSAITRL